MELDNNNDSKKALKRTIYIANLVNEALNNQELIKSAFIPFGEITSINISKDPQTQKPLGYAHLEYEEQEDCEHAIENMNNSEFFGRTLKVSYAKAKKLNKNNKAIWDSEEYVRTVAVPVDAQ